MNERRIPDLTQQQVDRSFEEVVAGVRISDEFVAVETVAQDARVGWLVDYTHYGDDEHIRDVSEYIELTAQIAESHGVDPEVMSAAIALREEQELYEQA